MTDHDFAYAGLVDVDERDQWAFGTSFDDPLAGVDTTLPDGIDAADLATYCLMLADDALVLAQRLAQCATHAPELEEEVALANIGLDLLGQARLLLARAAAADPTVVPALPAGSPVPAEDALAFFRADNEFRNVRLVELGNGDFAGIVLRLLVFTTFRLAQLRHLSTARDSVLAAVAAKGVNEVTYHRDYAARWVVTLAGGTGESRRRIIAAAQRIWPYVPELFTTHAAERRLAQAGTAVEPEQLREEFDTVIAQVLEDLPEMQTGTIGSISGRDGVHTESMGALVAEMQSVARSHPMGRW